MNTTLLYCTTCTSRLITVQWWKEADGTSVPSFHCGQCKAERSVAVLPTVFIALGLEEEATWLLFEEWHENAHRIGPAYTPEIYLHTLAADGIVTKEELTEYTLGAQS